MDETGQNPNQTIEEPLPVAETPGSVTWTASEFIAHEKSAGWYVRLALAAWLVSVIIFLITRDLISVAVVIVGAVFLGIYAARPPRQMEYTVDQRGISIGGQRHDYNEFKSFSVIADGAFSSLVFMPLRRFATLTTIYYAPEDEKKILDLVSTQLPYEEPRRDAVDNLMRRIRF